MPQVTIYLEDDALEAVKAAAARAHISVSKWFAQFAEAERASLSANRQKFWQEIDRLRPSSEEESLGSCAPPWNARDNP